MSEKSKNTMRAMIYLEPGKLEMQEIPMPKPGPEEILVKIRAALTCGTDLKTYRRGHPVIKPPTVFGHELAGDVVEVGSAVQQFKPGMRVVAHNSAPCGHCYWCKHGQQSMCENPVYNFGAYAEYIVIPAPIVRLNTYQIPDHISYQQAAIMEPLSTVVHGQAKLNIQPGERVAIIGAGGPIGLMHLQMALLHGASQVIAVDMKDSRLQTAKELGATQTINPQKQDLFAEINRLTDGIGVDAVIESAGAVEAWQNAVKVVRKGGRVLWFGGLPQGTSVQVDSYDVHYRELTFYGIYHCTPVDVYHAYQLICSETINAKKLITGQVPLSGVEEALLAMYEGKCIKMAVVPDMEE